MKTKIFTLLFLAATFLSCETNENNLVSISDADLIGEWNIVEQMLDVSTSLSVNGEKTTFNTTSFGKDFNFKYTFYENPKTVTAKGIYTSVITTKINGQSSTQEIVANSVDGLDSGTWEIKNNIIIFKDNNNISSEAEVLLFTGNKIRFKLAINETIADSGDSININGEMFLTLERD